MKNNYDRYRHQSDKGIRRKIRWLILLPKFWFSPISRSVVDLVSLRPGDKALDLGSGMGPAAVLMAKRGALVFAVDPSRFMRVILSFRRQIQRNSSKIVVKAGAAEELPLLDNSIEVVVAVNTVHHWTNLEKSVSELVRVLNSRGRATLVDEDFTHPDHPKHETHHDHENEMTTVDVSGIADMFRKAGLQATGEKSILCGVPVKMIQASFSVD